MTENSRCLCRFQRVAGRCEAMDSEWTREGSLKSNLRVDADGNLDRYLQECMMVHD